MTAQSVAEKLGGEEVLKTDVRSDLDLVEAIHKGLPIRTLEVVLNKKLLKANEIYALVAPRRTLAHRKERQKTLSPDQSDRLARVLRVLTRAEEALGSREKAGRWMRKENRALGGRRPLDLLESDVGSRMVERVLGRIEYGVYS